MSLSNNQDVSLNESGGINNNNDYSHAMRHAEDTTPAALLEQLIYVDTFMPDADPTTLDEQLTAELAAFADDSFIFPDEDKPKDHDGNGNGYDLGGLAKSSDHMTNQNSNKNNGNDNNNNNNNNNSNNSNNSNNNHVLNNLNFSEQLRNHDSLSNNNSENNNNNNSNDTNADVLSQSLVTILSSQGNFSNSIINSLSSSLLSGVPKVHVPAGVQSTLVSAGLTQIQIDALAALIAQHQLKSNHNGDIFNNNDLNGGFNASAVDVLSGYSDSSAANGGGLLNNFTQPASQQQQQQHVNQTNFQAQSPENLLSSIVNLLNSQTHNQAQQNTSLSSQGQDQEQQKQHQQQQQPHDQTIKPSQVISALAPNQEARSSLSQSFISTSPANSMLSPDPLRNQTSSTNNFRTNSVAVSPETIKSDSTIQIPPEDTPSSSSSLSGANNSNGAAVDIDKRRRNTAASARFRIKKKLKEQEMERKIKDLNESSHKLQMRIQQLEMENRLLRNLVVEKGAQRDNDELERLKQRARESNNN